MKKLEGFLFGLVIFCLLTGCATNRPKRDLVILLPDPDGKGGAVTVTTKGGSQILEQPGYATEVESAEKAPLSPRPVSQNEIDDLFGAALAAQPDATDRFASFILFFEHDTVRLTKESKELLPEVLKSIKARKSNEIYIVGHTDLVGTEEYNIELSSKRARYVRDLLVSNGIKASSLFVWHCGKARPLVPTRDGVSEPRNRRVEIIAR